MKIALSKWQTVVGDESWDSLFWNNHDLPRIVSRWGNDKEYRVKSAKMLATLLHGMKGTPYIYQGEELGMTNVKFNSIKDYNNILDTTKFDYGYEILNMDNYNIINIIEEMVLSTADYIKDNNKNIILYHYLHFLFLNDYQSVQIYQIFFLSILPKY